MDTAYPFPAEFTVPAELRGQTPRRVLLTGSGIQLTLAGAILLALAVAGVFWIENTAAWPTPRSQFTLMLVVAAVAALAVTLFTLLGIDYRIAARGMPALAMVGKCTQARSGFFVKYRLRLGEETWVEGHGWCKCRQEPGNGIWVLYLPGKPRRNRPYPLTYCRTIE